jgi:hypothetical protein
VPSALTALSWLALAYNPLLYGVLPAAFTTSKLYAWSGYHQTYNSLATITTSGGSYGAAPTYGSGVLQGTSLGLSRSMISILRDAQAGLDPRNTSALAASWGGAHLQPCAPWRSGLASNPGQRNTSAGYGRAWLGVTCAEWDGSVNVAIAKYSGLSDLNVGLASLTGTIPVALCELFPSMTFLDLGQNALVGSLPSCFGQQSATVSGRFALSVFDNMVIVLRTRLMHACAAGSTVVCGD